MHLSRLLAVALLCATTAFSSTLHLAVNLTAGGETLLLDSLRYSNAAGETWSITRCSFLLSGFALQKMDGNWMEMPDQIAWLDAERRRLDTALTKIPAGKYQALRFHLGLDPAANAAPTAQYAPDHPLNPNLNGLHWSWQGGYIFLALEGSYRAAGQPPGGFSYHLARDPNRTALTYTGDFDLTADAAAAFTFDIHALLSGARPLSFAGDGLSTHSHEGDPVVAALKINLPAAFTLQQISSSIPTIARPSPVKPLYLPAKHTAYRFTMSSYFPIPPLPRDNPLLEERVALGRRLFNDTAFSRDGTLSCASCHTEANAFTDARRFSIGVEDRVGTRNGMPLFNLAWKTSFFWDGRAPSLRAQALMPVQDHLEMDEKLENVVAKLEKTSKAEFARAFDSDAITPERIGLALENYLLTLTSYDSKFDRAMQGKDKFTPAEQRGFELFMTEYEPRMGQRGADCFHCHGGPLFTDHQFHNNGLSPVESDTGRHRVTQNDRDLYKFSTPSLRNIALTAPYMHDGRFQTLEEVIAHYDHNLRRSDTLDPNLAKHPATGIRLSADDKAALVAFLKTLTDEKYTK
ncbi:MbnP family protein [Prosthecobacter sp.]|uniref:MbnP family protein n=1 Tax=Prosthecobacter sp. TaxID=1965333 RepID=UPI0037838A10